MEKMVSFSKLPGIVAFCIVVLTRTLGSAAPVPQTNDGAPTDHGLASISEPLLSGVANPLLTGVGNGVADLADGTLADTADDILKGAGDTFANLAPAVHDTMYVQP